MAARHPISPDIYGVTIFWDPSSSHYGAFTQFASAVALPVNRHGGDGTTRYNWTFDSSNAGSDFYFMGGNGQSTVTPGASVDTIVSNNRTSNTKSIITVPIIDYINNGSQWHCSYPNPPVTNQTAYNPYIKLNNGAVQCGSGTSNATNQYIADGNPLATDVLNAPSIQAAWVTHLVAKFGQGAHGGVPIYELDNEPNGWIAVHHDIRPQNIGYGELLTKSLAYARAIKGSDPTALVLGPGDIAPADGGCNGGGVAGTCTNDSVSHSTPLGLYYLQQFAAASAQAGRRLLDYYSMHYPGACCFSNNGSLDAMVTAIHRHQGWIAQGYPGTKLGYDEWNRGTGSGFSNALATADGLGVFGREGVDLASFWGLDDPAYPTGFTYRMFRNYDAKGGAFGETSVGAASGDATKLTVYAATRASDGALTIMVINPTASTLTSALALSNFTVHSTPLVYRYSQANQGAIVSDVAPQVNGSTLYASFAPMSLTMLVVR